jgi:hypothetical protein
MATLRLTPASGPSVEVDKESAMVGRDPTCEVVVNDGSVSRKHALLERRADGWAVVDQGSANGTFLDSQRISESVLQTGQELRFGAVAYQVEIEGDEGATIVTAMPDPTVLHPTPTPPPLKPPAPPRAAPPPAPPTFAPPAFPPPGAAPPPPPPPRAAGPPPPPRPSSRPPGGSVPAPPMGGAPPKKGKGPLFWILTGCCGCILLMTLAAGGCVGFIAMTTGDAVKVARDQMEDLKSGATDTAYSRMSEGYRARYSAADFAAWVDRHPALKSNKDSTFLKRSVENDRGHLEGILTGMDGTVEPVTYELVKEAGSWKIDQIKFVGEDLPVPGGTTSQGGGGPGSSSLSIETVDMQKNATGSGAEVAIKIRVSGFSVRPEGDAFRMDLAQDLETRGPDGSRIEELSRVGLKTLNDTTPQATGTSAEFDTNLTLARFEPGRYVARLTIRDLVAGDLKTHEVPFDLP